MAKRESRSKACQFHFTQQTLCSIKFPSCTVLSVYVAVAHAYVLAPFRCIRAVARNEQIDKLASQRAARKRQKNRCDFKK
jgi:hypothetical protein